MPDNTKPEEVKKPKSDSSASLPVCKSASNSKVQPQNYAYEYEVNKKHISWEAVYFSDKIQKVGILATRDVKNPATISRDEGNRRKMERLIEAAGGFTEKNALASVFYAYDKNDNKINLPIEYQHVFIRNGTVDEAANQLVNKLNQYFGVAPWKVYHF